MREVNSPSRTHPTHTPSPQPLPGETVLKVKETLFPQAAKVIFHPSIFIHLSHFGKNETLVMAPQSLEQRWLIFYKKIVEPTLTSVAASKGNYENCPVFSFLFSTEMKKPLWLLVKVCTLDGSHERRNAVRKVS